MNRFVYISLIFFIFLIIGCADHATPKSESEKVDISTEEETIIVSTEEAYQLLITQKIQEQVDKKNLQNKHPQFTKESINNIWIPEDAVSLKNVTFIEDIEFKSDTINMLKTQIVFTTKKNTTITDTIFTKIKISEVQIDGSLIKTNEIKFTPLPPKKVSGFKIKNSETTNLPTQVSVFSLKNLNFTWEEINACDCLFMVPSKNKHFDKLFFGRFKGDSSGIIQLGKNSEKFIIPIQKVRSKNRQKGSPWKETYQNSRFKIQIKASPTQSKVKGKFTYYIDFLFMDSSLESRFTKTILANCKF